MTLVSALGNVGVLDRSGLRNGLLGWLRQNTPYRTVLEALEGADVNAFIVGGAVRDFLLEQPEGLCDLDLVIPGLEAPTRAALERLSCRSRTNRHGNFRYWLPFGGHFDVIDPRCFYR